MKFTDNIFAVFAPVECTKRTSLVNIMSVCENTFKNTPNDIRFISNNDIEISLIRYSKNNIISDKNNFNANQKIKHVNFSDSKSLSNQDNVQLLSVERIDNKKALSEQLTKNVPDNYTNIHHNENIIKQAYSAWGKNSFGQLKGSFCSILWDENKQEAHAAIDPFSGRSLFYLAHEGMLFIGSDAQMLAQVSGVHLTVNKVALSQWLAGRPDPNGSMFNEIKMLAGGHSLVYRFKEQNEDPMNDQHKHSHNKHSHNTLHINSVKPQRIELTKFWDISPEFSIRYHKEDDYTSHFLELLTNSVNDRLIGMNHAINNRSSAPEQLNARVFCQMSGGMDSTSVTALAKQLLDKQQQPLHTLSHRYKNTESCDESDNITDMINTLNLQHQHYIELDQFHQSSFADLYPTAFDNPGIVLSPKYHQELNLMNALGAEVLLTGNGGDETCWGHSDSYKTRLYQGEFGVVTEVMSACKTLNEPVVRSLYKLFMPEFMKNLVNIARNKPIHGNDVPDWLTEESHALVDEGNALLINPYSSFLAPAKHARYQGLKTTSTYNSMRSYQRVASQYGIDVRHPFFDTEIVEFSFAIPEKMLIQGVYPKWLLRQTMTPFLPDSVCWNKQKVVFDHHFANLVRSNKAELRELLAHTGLQELGLLNNEVLLQQFDAVVDNPNGQLHVDMLYAILTQLWYQTHCL